MAPDAAGWLAEYNTTEFELPKIAGKFTGHRLIIVGDSANVWDDLDRFGCKVTHRRGCVAKDGWHFMTVNKIVETFPGNIEHAFSNNAVELKAFITARRTEYRQEFTGPRYTHSGGKGADHRWPWSGWGTSALGAVFVGLMLGYEPPIVLCGVPLDDGPHNGEPPWRRCAFSREVSEQTDGEMNRHWLRMKKYAPGMVRSMSGRTREWLGAP